ncbi:low-density lipoprotein receptor-related protein 2, partial [Octopus bimaculoides]
MIYVVGLAVDWIGRNLYWTDSSKRTIEVSNLRGDHRMILLKQNQSRPRAIKVDPREDFRYLFWTEWQVNPSIHRMDLDGENEIVIVNKKLFWPVGLAIDFPNKRLYFIEGRMDYIGFCGYDGSGRTQLFANEH